jgi:hypothetical protein
MFRTVPNSICAQQMCSVCKETVDCDIDCTNVANLFMCCGWTTQEIILTTAGIPEYSRIIFILFHKIMVNTVETFSNWSSLTSEVYLFHY